MEEQRFDDLARLIGRKTSRRQVLKVLAGAALGGMFANRLSPALAAGNSTCAQFCTTVFGEDTLAQSQCVSDAARHKGLCYSACGPGGSGTLCGPQSGGYYTSYSGTTCCASSQTCDTSTYTCSSCSSSTCAGCSASCAGSTCTCGAGTVALATANGTTTCAKPSNVFATGCASGLAAGDTSGIYCANTVTTGDGCASTSDCPAGFFCAGRTGQTVCFQATC